MQSCDTDPAIPPRAGEEVDVARLDAWLRAQVPDWRGPTEIRQFPSGHSNLTYLVTGGGLEMVLRRPPHGSRVKSAHDMGREYKVLSRLHALYHPAPRPLAYCSDPDVLGAPFYLMERRRGFAIRKQLPENLAGDAAALRRLSESLVDRLAELHSVDVEAAGGSALGKPQGYVQRQIEGWTRRWHDAQTEPIPPMDDLARWLAERMPVESGAAVIHNDYKLDNVLLDPAEPWRIVAVLDWEMATVGDPLMDLGTALSYWTERGDDPDLLARWFAPTTVPGFFTRRQFVERYFERSKTTTDDVLYYYVYGLFKVAVILQQIFFRFRHGLTQDDRFAGLGDVVKALARQGSRAVAAESLSPGR
jgi:aminoglycoside phosphotransferase (APT) family kinase protein